MRGTYDDPPRWRHGFRAAGLRSYTRFVGFRLGLATLFTRPRIVEGYTLYRFR